MHALPIMQWLLPSVEFGGGCALIIGLLSVLAAFGLFVICVGAFAFDAVKRIRAWQPIDRADWLGDLLYVPEALYCIGLTVVMLTARSDGATSAPPEKRGADGNDWEYRADPVKRQYQIIYTHDAIRSRAARVDESSDVTEQRCLLHLPIDR